VEKHREMTSLITNRSIPLKVRGSVYESRLISHMLYGSETWALTGKLEDILKSCDSRISAGLRWQDRISTEELARDVVSKCYMIN